MPAASPPRDRTKLEHLARVKGCRWANEDGTFCILETPDGHSIHVDADPAGFVTGQLYRFLGRWDEGKYGAYFKAATYTLDEPASRIAVVKYLADHCDGVGMRLAERLWEKYGPDAVRTLRETPDRVADAGLMTADAAGSAAGDLRQFAHMERTRLDLFGLVAGRGFPGKVIDRAVSRWGAKAPAVVRVNPFRLLTAGLPGAGFKRCDKLYLDLGGRPAALKRQALAGWNVLREDRSGSTWVPAERVVAGIAAVVPTAADPVKATRLAIRGGLVRVRREADGSKWVAAAEHARAEQRLADAVVRILSRQTPWPSWMDSGGDGQPSTHQAEQLLAATAKSVGCFVGGGGTGKTYSLAYLLGILTRRLGPGRVACCAPTGKAARRMTEAMEANGLSLRSTTIHQLLEISRGGRDGGGWGFQRNRDRPLDQPFLVVDEASMLDTSLAADLFDAVPPGGCVLLVGDPHQLAPVGHGAPLRDLLASPVVSKGELTEVRRNAGAIVHAGVAVRTSQPVAFSERFDLDAEPPANLRFLDCKPDATLDLLDGVLRSGLTRFGVDPVWETQVLVGVNEKGGLSRKAVNERLVKLLNPDGRRHPGVAFAVGDKVICLKNGMLRSVRLLEAHHTYTAAWQRTEAERYVANGETGKVLAVGQEGCVIEAGGGAVLVPKGKAKTDDAEGDGAAGGGLADWDHAYAVTAHKSQGSEWPAVIVLADPAAGGVADRHWWYTAISRASKLCLVIGDRAAFETHRRRESLVRRKTFLTELLAEPQGAGT